MHTVVTQAAAASGNLDVLIYLRSLDCPWSETIYLAAAEHEHLEILKWTTLTFFQLQQKVPIETCINGYLIGSARSRKNYRS